MDSLTQITLGACVAAACVPPEQRRKAALVGAALGTLPDLDVFIDYGGPVENFTMHRGFSHSLFVLAGFGALLWIALRRLWPAARQAPGRWFAAIFLALLTHPLLDAHTAYGTQLFWPSGSNPVSWATIFIIDPLYTLPLLAGMIAVLIRPASKAAGRWLMAGLALSTLYLGWSWTARTIVTANAQRSLDAQGITDVRLFITPAPLNTLLWRVVAKTNGGYYEGLDSVVADDGSIEFIFRPSDDQALAAALPYVPAAQRLQWFANGFVGAAVQDDTLTMTDLRMGQHPDYVFRHSVARRGNPHWHAIEAQRLPTRIGTEFLASLWRRIWTDAAVTTGFTAPPRARPSSAGL
ncbi:MAG: metal-dependent hydrolase [Chthoniobacterales bacterium]|nr:metal-dependent hydrolase [Chthoniobacterales bacterium]